MNILITGAQGFIGKNLSTELVNRKYSNLFLYTQNSTPEELDHYCKNCDFVFHLAGVNRPIDPKEFMEGNFGFTSTLLDTLKKHQNKAPIMLSSSIQAELDNDYGKSKKAGEELLKSYALETGVQVYIYRFPNVFGKWSQPNYNSAVATFCHNIARDLPIQINDPKVMMNLVYIDDVVNELVHCLKGNPHQTNDLCFVPVNYHIELGKIVELLQSFRLTRQDFSIPQLSDPIVKKLYSTYLSFLPENQFSYPLKMNVDARGSFSEVIKTIDRGQVSINVAKPGITKGNHWHHTKNEKFLVVSGQAVIRFRKIDSDKIIEYQVSGETLEVVDIPCGYTHNIQNVGSTDLVTVMWANELLDPDHPDTFFLEV